MKRRTIMTLVASAALCLTMLPGPVSARMGGGGHGGGMHGGMGMHGAGFGGGMRGGFHSAPVAFHPGHFGNNFASRHNNFAFRHRGFIHDRFAFRHHRFRHFPHSFFVAAIGDDCFVVRQMWTPWGWRWRRVWVCG